MIVSSEHYDLPALYCCAHAAATDERVQNERLIPLVSLLLRQSLFLLLIKRQAILTLFHKCEVILSKICPLADDRVPLFLLEDAVSMWKTKVGSMKASTRFPLTNVSLLQEFGDQVIHLLGVFIPKWVNKEAIDGKVEGFSLRCRPRNQELGCHYAGWC